MAVFQPPPTYAEPVIVDEATKKSQFNPIWLKWFLDFIQIINESGGGGGAINHNDTAGIQGGSSTERYHLTQALAASLATLSGILAGNGAPGAGLGSNGNFYFRYDGTAGSSNLIYHKEAGSWTGFI